VIGTKIEKTMKPKRNKCRKKVIQYSYTSRWVSKTYRNKHSQRLNEYLLYIRQNERETSGRQ